jgi:outer membrane protein OmpA-like peptidoglycan-associated protein
MMPHAVDTVSIQIYNGQIPLLGAISFAYIARPIAPATPATTPSVPTTDTATAGMMDDQLPQSPSVVALRLSVPYRPNSYFLNLKARAAIAKIAAKYKKANLDRIVITGFVSPGPKNPYPKYLGLQRAIVVKKFLLHFGLKATIQVRYGGFYKDNSENSRKALLQIYLAKPVH